MVNCSGKGQGNEHHQVHNLFTTCVRVFSHPSRLIKKEKVMLELVLLPWTLFKYVFSLGLWFALFMTLHYQWKKRNVSALFVKMGNKIFKKNQKPVNKDLDDYYNSL